MTREALSPADTRRLVYALRREGVDLRLEPSGQLSFSRGGPIDGGRRAAILAHAEALKEYLTEEREEALAFTTLDPRRLTYARYLAVLQEGDNPGGRVVRPESAR